jgi:Phospholipase_D-nuclease N-terminal
MLLPTLIAIPLLIIWVLVLVDIIRRRDLGTGSKVLWALAALVFPIVGVIVYLIARPAQATDKYLPSEAGEGDASSFEPMRHGPA